MQGFGTAFAGVLAYLGARFGAQAGKENADKAIFVQIVTSERGMARSNARAGCRVNGRGAAWCS